MPLNGKTSVPCLYGLSGFSRLSLAIVSPLVSFKGLYTQYSNVQTQKAGGKLLLQIVRDTTVRLHAVEWKRYGLM